MSVSWPLLAYTLCSLVACGTLGVQGALALRGHGTKVQTPAIVAVIALTVLGAAFACMRFGRLDRIFNVFGNPASAIAQGYYALVLVLVVAVVFLVLLRRSEEEGTVPAGGAAVAVLAALVGVYALAANDTATINDLGKRWLTVAYFLCAAAVSGTLVCTGIQAARGEAALRGLGVAGVVAACASGAMTVVYALVAPHLGVRAQTITSSTYGIVPGHPSGTSAGDVAALPGLDSPVFWVGVVALGIAVPLVGAVAARKVRGAACAAVCLAAVVCLLVGVGCALELFLPSNGRTQVFM